MKRPSFLRYFICLFDFELVLLPRFFLPAELVFFERFLRDFFFQKRSPRRGGLFGRHFLLLVMTELFRYKSVAPALHLLLRQRVSKLAPNPADSETRKVPDVIKSERLPSSATLQIRQISRNQFMFLLGVALCRKACKLLILSLLRFPSISPPIQKFSP